MDKKVLNNLKAGEKVVKIEKYNCFDNVYYKVTVYTCEYKFLWMPKIYTYVIPFYFATKELVEEFLQYYDEFNWGKIDACENSKWIEAVQLKLENYSNRHEYCMLDVSGHKHLMFYGIWGGLVNTEARFHIDPENTINYKEIFDKEEKLIDVNDKNKTNEYLYKMTKI